MIYNYVDDKVVNEVIKKIKKFDIIELNIELVRLGIIYNKLINLEIEEFLDDIKM